MSSLPQSEPVWKNVRIPGYENGEEKLKKRLQDRYGDWDYKLYFFADHWNFRVPDNATKSDLRKLKEDTPPPPSTSPRGR